MAIELDIRREINKNQIFEVFKFEISLKKKRYLLVLVLGLIIVNLYGIVMAFFRPPNSTLFIGSITANYDYLILFFSLFFAGGILADEFDKRTALTNFTKTGRTNFFIGKSLAVFSIVLIWICPCVIELAIYSWIYYNNIPTGLIGWCIITFLSATTFTAIYLLHSAVFRSGSQAMTMSFVTIMILGTAFGLSIAFLGSPYYYPFYAEMVGQSLITGDVLPDEMGFIMNSTWAIIMLLCYLIPSIILAYVFFKKRDV